MAENPANTDDDLLSQTMGKFLTGKEGYKAEIEQGKGEIQKPEEPEPEPVQEENVQEEPKEEVQQEQPNTLKCPKCQDSLTGKENFCPNCGLKIELKLMCCGKELPRDAKFCPVCGKTAD